MFPALRFGLFAGLCSVAAFGQGSSLACRPTANPLIMRAEGIAERAGDLVLTCTGGQAGATVTGNLSLFLNVNLTNRIAPDNSVTGLVVTADNGSGPQPLPAKGVVTGAGSLVFNGFTFTLSPTGAATLRIANIRADASQLQLLPNSVTVQIGFDAATIANLPGNIAVLGTSQRGLYATTAPGLSFLPPQNMLSGDVPVTFSGFTAAGIPLFSTRVTEGFADAFAPRNAAASLNADTGTRILIRYSGYPAGARLLAPDLVAGSDALAATAGGDLGVAVNGGMYSPSLNGSLLLARVPNADSNGAGGVPAFSPASAAVAPLALDAISDVPLTNGAGYAVYEVVDANPAIQESAQFPSFVVLPPFLGGPATAVTEQISLAPLSTLMTASPTAPIPRFITLNPPSDCTLAGDCGARYFPKLAVAPTSLDVTSAAGGNFQVNYLFVRNAGGGTLNYNAAISYQSGSGWLRIFPESGSGNATLRLDIVPANLAPGAYRATITVDSGPLAGAVAIPVTLTVTAAVPQPPTVQAIVNGASFGAGVVPGSIATVQGSRFTGANPTVTFDGAPAQVLFSNATQINVVVPSSLTGKATSQVIVGADGRTGQPFTVSLSAAAPAIFANGVLNQDNSVESMNQPAAVGSILQIFATGLPLNGVITAHIHDREITDPIYAGPAPGLPGVQQINATIPGDLPAMTTDLLVCGTVNGQRTCSPAYRVTLTR